MKGSRAKGKKQPTNTCAACQHFVSAHGPRGCTVSWCDCKLKQRVEKEKE